MCGRAGPSKKAKTYPFHQEWEEDFFFTMSYLKCVCEGTFKLHSLKKPQCCIPSKMGAKKEKGEGTKITVIRTAANEALFRVTDSIIKHEKSF